MDQKHIFDGVKSSSKTFPDTSRTGTNDDEGCSTNNSGGGSIDVAEEIRNTGYFF